MVGVLVPESHILRVFENPKFQGCGFTPFRYFVSDLLCFRFWGPLMMPGSCPYKFRLSLGGHFGSSPARLFGQSNCTSAFVK